MAIKYQARIKGFIVGDVNFIEPEGKKSFFTARAGQERFERLPDGKFKELPNEYFKVLQFGDQAEASSQMFVPGNHFIAYGHINERPYTNKKNERVMAYDFIAEHIELDPSRPQPKNTGAGVAPAVEQAAASEELDQALQDSTTETDAPEAEAAGLDAEDPESSLSEPEPEPEPEPERAQRRLPTVPASGVSRSNETVGAGHEFAR